VQQSRSKRARRNPSPRMIKVTVHVKRRVNEEQPTPASSPSRNHDSAAPRQHPLICTCAEPIHQVHGPPKPRATESMLRNRIHISAIFSPFFFLILGKLFSHIAQHVESCTAESFILKVSRLLTASFRTFVGWHQVQVHPQESILQGCLIDGLLMCTKNVFHGQLCSEQLGFCVGSTHTLFHSGRQHVCALGVFVLSVNSSQ